MDDKERESDLFKCRQRVCLNLNSLKGTSEQYLNALSIIGNINGVLNCFNDRLFSVDDGSCLYMCEQICELMNNSIFPFLVREANRIQDLEFKVKLLNFIKKKQERIRLDFKEIYKLKNFKI